MAIATIFIIIGSGSRFSAFNDEGQSTGGATDCGFIATGITVMDEWQTKGIMNICQQEIFINAADDAQYSYSQDPKNSKDIAAFKSAIDKLLASSDYKAAAKAGDYSKMRSIEDEILSPIVKNVLPFILKMKKAFNDSGGKKITKLIPGKSYALFKINSAYAGCDDEGLGGLQAETVDGSQARDKLEFDRDCWKPLKWPKGWFTGPSPLGLPGWSGLRNPNDLPGWDFGGGPLPGGGHGGFLEPPGGGGWGLGLGTTPLGDPWVGIGGGNENGGGFVGYGSGGTIIISGGIRF